jgi:predicted glycosyltransferase
MRVLFDISHPAHVHFFKHMICELMGRGHETAIVARDKDVTHALLAHYGLEFISSGRSGHRHVVARFAELVQRDWALFRVARRFKPDVILTRNPCGVQVARLVGARGIFDTDDGVAAGLHFRLARPFAHVITTPDCLPDDFGRKHVRYPGYKQMAYLHPDHFTPDPGVLERLGVAEGEPYSIVRFVAMTASHDTGHAGLGLGTKEAIIRRLDRHGRVFITSEAPLPERWEAYRAPIPPEWIHHALAFASLYIGDSQTMAAEAAVLGTPSLRCSSFAGRLPHLNELQERYGLTAAFPPGEADALLRQLDEWLAEPDLKARFAAGRERLLAEKCNVARWMVDYLHRACPAAGAGPAEPAEPPRPPGPQER